MNYSTILALLVAVSTFPASHGVLIISDRAAPKSSTITTVATATTLVATTLTTKTAKEPSSHDAAMQTQPGDVLDADVPKMKPPTATDAVTTITNSTFCKELLHHVLIENPLGRDVSTPGYLGDSVVYLPPRIFAAEMRAVTRTINAHGMPHARDLRIAPPRARFSYFFTSSLSFPSSWRGRT